MKLGLKLISILLTVFLISSIFPLFQIPNAQSDLIIQSSMNNRNPIHIKGDGQFTLSQGVVSGNGMINNPYIIENWSIEY